MLTPARIFITFQVSLRLALSGGFLISPWSLIGQTFTGAIGGHVTDPAGLAIPGAEVVTTEMATNEVFKTVTNEAGDYSIAFLKPGVFRLRSGSKASKRQCRASWSSNSIRAFVWIRSCRSAR